MWLSISKRLIDLLIMTTTFTYELCHQKKEEMILSIFTVHETYTKRSTHLDSIQNVARELKKGLTAVRIDSQANQTSRSFVGSE